MKRVSLTENDFPLLLKEIPSPPKQIFVLGSLPSENELKIAIVGTRKATTAGKNIAYELAKKLSSISAVVISGLAMGIDTSAHQGALSANGKTLAILANGLDKIYPSQNENLAKKIVENNGALISEYPAGTPSYPNQFLQRNRIISGLCAATIIIEAPERSGSLATARFALEQGREVFVVPGPSNHPNYTGSHKLIRDGARLISSFENLLEDLGFELTLEKTPLTENSSLNLENVSSEEKIILTALKNSAEPLKVDKISQETNISTQSVNQIIAMLIIKEIVQETEQGYTL